MFTIGGASDGTDIQTSYDNTDPNSYGPFSTPSDSPSLPPYSPDTTTSEGTGVSPTSLMQVNNLAASLSNLGLSWYSTITQKPVIAAVNTQGQVVNPQQTNNTQMILIVGVIAIAALLIIHR